MKKGINGAMVGSIIMGVLALALFIIGCVGCLAM